MHPLIHGEMARLRQRELLQEADSYRRLSRSRDRLRRNSSVRPRATLRRAISAQPWLAARRQQLGLALIELGRRVADPAVADRLPQR